MDDCQSLSHAKWECKYHMKFNSGSIWARCSSAWQRRKRVESKRDLDELWVRG